MNVHPIHKPDHKKYVVFRKSSHIYFCQLNWAFQFLSSELCDNNPNKKRNPQHLYPIPCPHTGAKPTKIQSALWIGEHPSKISEENKILWTPSLKKKYALSGRKLFTDNGQEPQLAEVQHKH